MECQYCKTILINKYSLQLHQKRTKYCLKIQEKTNDKIQSELLICDSCKKSFSVNNFKRHIHGCKIKKNKEQEIFKEENNLIILSLKNEVASLKEEHSLTIASLKEENILLKAQLDIYKNLSNDSQQCIKEIAKQPKTTSNTTNKSNTNILNLAPLDMADLTERITQIINTKMTDSHVIDGQEGVARLVSCCFKTDDGRKLITCTDTSRGIWKSKDIGGNIIKDYKANNIAKVIKPIAILKANKITEIDTIKRNKISEITRIKRARDENIKAEKFDIECQTAYLEGSVKYNIIEDRIQRRILRQREDDRIERELIEEFEINNEMDLLDYPDDDNKPYKMCMGKKDIIQMSDDSTRFSNKLVNLV